MTVRSKLIALFSPALIVIVLDQWTKWIIRTSPELHRYDIIEGWLMFYYTQNSGMALGIDILDTTVVSLISITATLGILGYLLYNLKQSSTVYLLLMGLVLGGAIGNIIDRLTMGYIEGYGGLLEGHVVDFIFFYLEIFDKTIFPYIFNVADMAISVSVITLLIFNRIFFPKESTESEELLDNETNSQEIEAVNKESNT